jgi:flagellar biosynthesis/type III secretory pathway chaperone
MSLSSACEQIGRVLQKELNSSSDLLAILKAEHEAIAHRDTDALQQAVADKQELLAQLDASYGQRLQLMHDAGLDPDKGGFEELLSRCAAGGHDLQNGWDAVKEALLACQRQNQINGTVLESSRRTTHRALSVLLGGQGESTELYNQAGKSTPTLSGGNRVIKA